MIRAARERHQRPHQARSLLWQPALEQAALDMPTLQFQLATTPLPRRRGSKILETSVDDRAGGRDGGARHSRQPLLRPWSAPLSKACRVGASVPAAALVCCTDMTRPRREVAYLFPPVRVPAPASAPAWCRACETRRGWSRQSSRPQCDGRSAILKRLRICGGDRETHRDFYILVKSALL